MKKFTKINYILTFILVFCIGATLPILIGSSHVDEQHSANRKCLIASPHPPSLNRSPLTERQSTSAATTVVSGWTGR